VEAYALALRGRHEEALRLVDALRVPEPEAELARMRIRLAGGSGLPAPSPPAQGRNWRHGWELARLEAASGRHAEAVRRLREAVTGLRAVGDPDDEATSILAAALTADVERLTGGGSLDPEPPTDGRALLRLVELGRRLAGEEDPEEVLRVVVHEAIALTDAARGFLVVARGENLEFAVAESVDRAAVEDPALEVSRALIREVRRARRTELLVLDDLPRDHPAQRSLVAIGARAVICVPMVEEDRVFGVIYLDGPGIGDRLPPGRRRLLEVLTAQATAAFRASEHHRETSLALEAAQETLRRRRTEQEHRDRLDDLVGSSPAMQSVYRQLDRILATEEPVILTGETGTGKDLVAELIHRRSPRAAREFVPVNCAALSETLLESELFGYERGAFTGADRSRPGLFELADGGTLFLDEVGDMSPRMQADLLRVLQSGEVRRVGARHTRTVSVRIVAATHRELETLVRQGEFRQDLFYRLHVLTIRMPPLRERAGDVEGLVAHLLPRIAGDAPAPRIAPDAMSRLAAHSWPGNVRELENVLRRLVATGRATIRSRDLPPELRRSSAAPAPLSLKEAEARAIRHALKATKGNKTRAARILGINRATLYTKLREMEERR
jgi:Nif-specific regulatory protein